MIILPAPEGDSLYSGYQQSSSVQARRSVYNRPFAAPSGNRPVYEPVNNSSDSYVDDIVRYMLTEMEPTDRCLRPPGDIYPADGTRPGTRNLRGRRGLTAIPGDEPWDGESTPEPGPVSDPYGWFKESCG